MSIDNQTQIPAAVPPIPMDLKIIEESFTKPNIESNWNIYTKRLDTFLSRLHDSCPNCKRTNPNSVDYLKNDIKAMREGWEIISQQVNSYLNRSVEFSSTRQANETMHLLNFGSELIAREVFQSQSQLTQSFNYEKLVHVTAIQIQIGRMVNLHASVPTIEELMARSKAIENGQAKFQTDEESFKDK